jgi:hypothetical protein
MKVLDSPKRGRPKKEAVMKSLALRVPAELIEQVDTFLDNLKDQLPGLSLSRADAVRQLIAVGLREENKRLK